MSLTLDINPKNLLIQHMSYFTPLLIYNLMTVSCSKSVLHKQENVHFKLNY